MALRTINEQDYSNDIAEISIDVISIMESSLRVVLINHVEKLRKSKDVVGSIALFLSLVVVLITAEFKSNIFDAKTWFGIFIVLTIAAGGYMAYVIVNHIKNKDSVDAIIADIKKARGGALTGVRVPTSLVHGSMTQSANPNSQQKQQSSRPNRGKKKRR